MAEPGTIDVTSRFDMIITFGFISNCIIFGWAVIQLIMGKDIKNYKVSTTMVSLCTTIMWATQFIWLLIIRFSQSGMVCSGEYDEFIALGPNRSVYDKYYMWEKGFFLQMYSICCLSISIGGIFCVGGCMACSFSNFNEQSCTKIEDYFYRMEPEEQMHKAYTDYMRSQA